MVFAAFIYKYKNNDNQNTEGQVIHIILLVCITNVGFTSPFFAEWKPPDFSFTLKTINKLRSAK